MKILFFFLTFFTAANALAVHPDWYYAVPKKMECLFTQDRIKAVIEVGDVPRNNPSFISAKGTAKVFNPSSAWPIIDYPYVEAHRRTDGKITVIYPYRARPASLVLIDTKFGETSWPRHVMAQLWPGPHPGSCKLTNQ